LTRPWNDPAADIAALRTPTSTIWLARMGRRWSAPSWPGLKGIGAGFIILHLA
jgi:hypothetical protein